MTEQAADGARWHGYTHEELYELLNKGPGPAASAAPAQRWQEISAALHEVNQRLQQALDGAGSAWSGSAAGSAYESLTPFASWAKDSSSSAQTMQTVLDNQADYLTAARRDMPVPQPAPAAQPDPTAAAASVAAVGTDHEGTESGLSADEQRAFQVMDAYEHNTNASLATMTPFGHPSGLHGATDLHSSHGDGVQMNDHTVYQAAASTPIAPRDTAHGQGDSHGHGRWQVPTHDGHGGAVTEQSHATYLPPAATERPQVFVRGAMTGSTMAELPYLGGTGVPGGRTSDDESSERGNTGNNTGNRAAAPAATSGRSDGTTGVGAGNQTASTLGPAGTQLGAPMGAPMAPGAPFGGGQTAGAGFAGGHGSGYGNQPGRVAPTGYGSDPIGSGQWFGDLDDTSRSTSQSRRRDQRPVVDQKINESISIDGQEFELPPGVIGGGPTA